MKCERCGQKFGRLGSTPDQRRYFICMCGHATPIADEAPYDPTTAKMAKEWDVRYVRYKDQIEAEENGADHVYNICDTSISSRHVHRCLCGSSFLQG